MPPHFVVCVVVLDDGSCLHQLQSQVSRWFVSFPCITLVLLIYMNMPLKKLRRMGVKSRGWGAVQSRCKYADWLRFFVVNHCVCSLSADLSLVWVYGCYGDSVPFPLPSVSGLWFYIRLSVGFCCASVS